MTPPLLAVSNPALNQAFSTLEGRSVPDRRRAVWAPMPVQ